MAQAGGGRSLPSGDVCFLFTDVESSSAILRTIGDAAWAEVQQRMQAIVRAAVEAGDGVIVNTEGDGCFAAFPDAGRAASACADAQRQLDESDWDGVMLRVRMGLHLGNGVTPLGDDYAALAVHQTARICAAAQGGQVLASAAVADRAVGADFADLGLFTVRDFDEPVRLFDLVRPDVPRLAPRVPAAFDARVPRYNTAMVGRDAEAATILATLVTSRLVSLVGPSGIGKTRLAVAVLAQMSGDLAVVPWFVDLGAAREARSVGDVISLAVGCPPDIELDVHLDAVLEDRAGVMVLDDCGRLAGAAAAAAALLLEWCPSLKVVTTSTEPLGVDGEVIAPVGPLTLPTEDTPAAILASDAGRLFLERAGRVRPSMKPTSSVARAVAHICAALDGVPLAVELAAALSARATPEQVSAVLRHTSTSALIEWSLESLGERELRSLAALSLAEPPIPARLARVALDSVAIPRDEGGEMLDELVARSLLNRDTDGGYRVPNPIRAQVVARIGSGDAADVRSRLLAECLSATAQPPVPLSMHEAVVPTASALIDDASLPLPDRQRLAAQLAPWWLGRLGSRRAREHLVAALAHGTSGPATAALHLAVADTYGGGRELLDAQQHISAAARLIGEYDAVDPDLVERLKSMTARAADPHSSTGDASVRDPSRNREAPPHAPA